MSEPTIEKILEVLNSALKADPKAITELILSKTVMCDSRLADHPTIPVHPLDNERCLLGPLGLVNGIALALTGKRIAACYPDDYETEEPVITGFVVYEPEKDEPITPP